MFIQRFWHAVSWMLVQHVPYMLIEIMILIVCQYMFLYDDNLGNQAWWDKRKSYLKDSGITSWCTSTCYTPMVHQFIHLCIKVMSDLIMLPSLLSMWCGNIPPDSILKHRVDKRVRYRWETVDYHLIQLSQIPLTFTTYLWHWDVTASI
jgi:hypothetical protein